MASEGKQCSAHMIEVKLITFPDGSKPTKADAHPAAAVAVAAVKRTLTRSISWLPLLSFAFMVYSAITAIIESKGERGTVLFVTGSFTLLGLLFICMKMFEETRGVPSRKGTLLKVAVWILSVCLTMLFSYRVTTIVDSPILDVFVWTIAVLTSAFGCYLLFLLE